ncbi:hypothetical protein, conserved, partial [Babesia bigemina]
MFTLTPNLSNYFSKLISLGHLAGQLGGFVGQSESVKKAVKNAIKACFDTNAHLKNDLNDVYNSLVTNLSVSVNPAGQTDDTAVIGPLQVEVSKKIAEITDQITQLEQQNKLNNHSLPSPSPSAELAKLHSKLEALKEVEKLCGFLTNSNKQQNNPTNNILTHLCDGLETFLGFDPKSKGYDGSGIVYSDLDRLCDGVMGFLSGVLSNIQNHLGQHKTQIDIAINILNTNKHLGKNGFNAAIGEVVAGVRGYNGNVKTSNDLVKTAIKKLQRDMKNYKKEELQTNLPNNIDPKRPTASTQESVEKAMSLVEQCQKFAKEFIRAVDIKTKTDATKNAIKDLNPKLRDTIENVRKNMQHESKRLKELSSKESKDLEATEDKIKKTLSSLKVNVDCRIDAQMKELIKKLSERVQKILDKLKGIEKKLLGYVKELYTWLEDARKLINE